MECFNFFSSSPVVGWNLQQKTFKMRNCLQRTHAGDPSFLIHKQEQAAWNSSVTATYFHSWVLRTIKTTVYVGEKKKWLKWLLLLINTWSLETFNALNFRFHTAYVSEMIQGCHIFVNLPLYCFLWLDH